MGTVMSLDGFIQMYRPMTSRSMGRRARVLRKRVAENNADLGRYWAVVASEFDGQVPVIVPAEALERFDLMYGYIVTSHRYDDTHGTPRVITTWEELGLRAGLPSAFVACSLDCRPVERWILNHAFVKPEPVITKPDDMVGAVMSMVKEAFAQPAPAPQPQAGPLRQGGRSNRPRRGNGQFKGKADWLDGKAADGQTADILRNSGAAGLMGLRANPSQKES